MHYARLHRALCSLGSLSPEARTELVSLLRTGPATLGKVLAKGPVGDIVGALADITPTDDPANLAVWQAVVDHLPPETPADLRFDLGADLRAIGDAARALPLLEGWVADEGEDDADAWLEVGDARVDLGNAQGAIDAWERSAELDETLAAPWARRGFLYAEAGMPDAAVAVFSQAVAREDDPEVWLALGRCLLLVGVADEAKDALQRAVAGFPADDPYAVYLRGAARALLGDAEEALNDLLSASASAPELLAAAIEDEDYLRLSSHPRWSSIAP